MTVETLGIDIAKNVFQLHGVNHHGSVVLKRRVMRDQLLDIVAQVERCTIVVEACTGAFCWDRKFEALGHQVKIISPQYVKPFVRRQKNDGNDAEAICTANANRTSRSSRKNGRAAGYPGPASRSPAHGQSSHCCGQPDPRSPARPRFCHGKVNYPCQAVDSRVSVRPEE